MHYALRVGIFLGLFLCLPSLASAATAAEIQAQIQTLLIEVQKLQADIVRQSGTTVTATTPIVPAGVRSTCPLIGRVLKRGMTGDDVSRLQTYLAADPSVYPEALVSGYFGALTEVAVQRWQTKYNIVSSGDPDSTGFGVLGPRTAAAISLQCSTGTGVTGGGGGGGVTTPTVGGFIQVTPVTGNAPLNVQVIATVNTVLSCVAATYALDWGDGTIPQSINVPQGNCGQVQQTYTHTYIYGGSYIVRLSSGQHSTTATVQVGGVARPN